MRKTHRHPGRVDNIIVNPLGKLSFVGCLGCVNYATLGKLYTVYFTTPSLFKNCLINIINVFKAKSWHGDCIYLIYLLRTGVRPMSQSKQFNVKQAAASLMLCLSGIGLTILDVAVLRRYK